MDFGTAYPRVLFCQTALLSKLNDHFVKIILISDEIKIHNQR